MPKGVYKRTIEHCINISKAKKDSGYKHKRETKAKIAASVSRFKSTNCLNKLQQIT